LAQGDEFIGKCKASEDQVTNNQTNDTKNHGKYDEIPHAGPLQNVLLQLYHAGKAMSILGPMNPSGAVLLHGYGVRGYIWGPMQAALHDRLGPVATPDLEAPNITDLLNKAKARIRRHSLECDKPVVVVGHSLGAVLAAVAARDLGPDIVSAVILLSPPFGEREYVPGKLLIFLLRHRLIPPILLRPRFFSSLTPRTTKRAVFKAAVRESPGIQSLGFEPRWFHSDYFPTPLLQPSLVIASPADRIVPVAQSEEFAGVLGGRAHLFDEEEGVAHDDLFASPTIVAGIAELIVDFTATA
jgi:pimeloyl-ACP methyl ester carboxylesterase